MVPSLEMCSSPDSFSTLFVKATLNCTEIFAEGGTCLSPCHLIPLCPSLGRSSRTAWDGDKDAAYRWCPLFDGNHLGHIKCLIMLCLSSTFFLVGKRIALELKKMGGGANIFELQHVLFCLVTTLKLCCSSCNVHIIK